MRIGIIGGGSTGLLMSYFFSKTHDVTTYVRRESQELRIREQGIKLFDSSKKAVVNVKLINMLNQEDLLIICVKYPDMHDVIKVLNAKAGNIPVLFLQNGMGHIPLIKELDNPVYIGTIEHGVTRINDYTVAHLGKGKINIASFNAGQANTMNLITQLNTSYFPVTYVADWEPLLKDKLIVNAVINPITALFDVVNYSIITNQYINKIAFELCTEAAKALQLDAETSWYNVLRIADSTGANTSSMRADINHKRQTEIDAILGYILKLTKAESGYVRYVYECIKAIEERNQLLNGDTSH